MVEKSSVDQGKNPTSDDEVSSLAKGYAWAMRITSIAIEMVLPLLVGIWIDRLCGTVVVFLILGAFFGMAIGILQIMLIARNGK